MKDPILELMILRWDVDFLVYLAEYDSHYWLKACYDKEGKRIGITSCCEYGYECKHHQNVKNKIGSQNVRSN